MSTGTPTRRRARHDEDHEGGHEGNERWLVTYADMVTLLMVLFIVMFAMSTVDEKKYQSLRNGLADGFGRSSTILNGDNPMRDSSGAENSGMTYDMLIDDLPQEQQEQVREILATADRLRTERGAADAEVEVDRLLEIWRKVDTALRAKGLRDDVRVDVDERGLVLSLVSEHVIFRPDIAQLSPRGQEVVDTIAPILAGLEERIEIDGHTNQEPVRPKYFPTDWELSTARAVHVLRRLQEVNGLPAHRLQATGFGHTRPLIDPDRPGSQRINKRVDVIVLSTAPAATRERFREIYQELTP